MLFQPGPIPGYELPAHETTGWSRIGLGANHHTGVDIFEDSTSFSADYARGEDRVGVEFFVKRTAGPGLCLTVGCSVVYFSANDPNFRLVPEDVEKMPIIGRLMPPGAEGRIRRELVATQMSFLLATLDLRAWEYLR